jgi:putative addiction module component (TIGR02574 family)
MSRTLLEEILELPAPARVEVVQRIWESIAAEADDVALTAAQRAELDRRWLAFQDNPDEGEDWDDVKRSLLEE